MGTASYTEVVTYMYTCTHMKLGCAVTSCEFVVGPYLCVCM